MWHGKQHRGAMRDRKQEKRDEAVARFVASAHTVTGRRLQAHELDARIYDQNGWTTTRRTFPLRQPI